MADFRDLGIREELLQLLIDEDISRPTAIQSAALPVVRRGGNLVAQAATGSGKTLAYALGVLDRLGAETESKEDADEEHVGVRALILRPTIESAEATAVAIFPFIQASGLSVSVPGGSWGTPTEAASVVVGTAAAVLEGVRTSLIKLDALEAIVVDGASSIQELGQLESLETLLDHLPRDSQRIVITAVFTSAINDLIDRRVKRALRYPTEAAVPDDRPAPAEGKLGYLLVSEAHKLEVLAQALSARESGGVAPILFFRTDERAATIAEQLTVRGFIIGELGDDDADVVLATVGVSRAQLAEEAEVDPGQTISYDVPADEDNMRARHAGDDDAIVIVEPGELPHLRMIAERARLETHSASLPISSSAALEVEAFRDQLRTAILQEDLGAQFLIIQPLLEEFSAAEIAAAMSALLRRRPASEPLREAVSARAAPRASDTARGSAVRGQGAGSAGPAPSTYARLFIGVGSRDGVRAGDLVGAIAGEADIPGATIGKIEIRDTFSIAEVPASAADAIIGALNGTTIKGRSVRVDYDRGADRARKPPPRRAGHPEAEAREPRRSLVRRPPRRD